MHRGGLREVNGEKAMRTTRHGLASAETTGAVLPIAGTLAALAILLMMLVA